MSIVVIAPSGEGRGTKGQLADRMPSPVAIPTCHILYYITFFCIFPHSSTNITLVLKGLHTQPIPPP